MRHVPDYIREPLLRRLSASDCPWTLIIVTTDKHAKNYVEKSLSLPELQKNNLVKKA
jgi:hypothetical protein